MIINRKDQKELYAHAVRNHYIIPACHFFDIKAMKAILEAAEEEHSPVIIQIGMPAHKTFEPLDKFIKYLKDYTSDILVPVMLIV